MTTTRRPETTPRATPRFEQVSKAIARRSFCTIATASATNRPHVAGVLYAENEGVLYISTTRTSRKARNLADNPAAFVCIPVRRLPVGPPSSVQFAATVDILAPDDPEIVRLAGSGRLKAITGHGELDLPGGCFLRVTPAPVIHTYGLGLPLRQLIRNPLDAAGRVTAA